MVVPTSQLCYVVFVLQDNLAWSEELFYVFNYDKPTGVGTLPGVLYQHHRSRSASFLCGSVLSIPRSTAACILACIFMMYARKYTRSG